MTLEEFGEQESRVRANLHFHDGVWWASTTFQCCRPVFPLQEIVPGMARPSPLRSLVSYSHVVPREFASGRTRTRLLMAEEGLRSFDVVHLERKRRQAISRAVRRGMTVKRIESLDELWPDMQELYRSTAHRTRYGLEEAYYTERESDWRAMLRREFALTGRDWFGAFAGGKLVAFLYGCLVDATATWLVAKCHADYLKDDPNDLLWSQVILHYAADPACSRIDAGWAISDPPSIDWRKCSMGFQRVELPFHQRISRLASVGAKSLLSVMAPILRVGNPADRRGLRYRAGVISARLSHMVDER